MVSPTTIENILGYFESKLPDTVKDVLSEYDLGLSWRRLGRELVAMNARAIMARYDEDPLGKDWQSWMPAPDIYDNLRPNTAVTQIQAVKSLKCYLYQCSEGDVPKEKLYNMLKKIEGATIRAIVENSQEYQDADWG
jgi:hypothetical protein